MLTDSIPARDLRLEVFEEDTAADLETAVQEWFDDQDEATVVGISFDADGDVTYRAYVLYSE